MFSAPPPIVIRVAEHDRLRRGNDRPQARTAKAIDVERWGAFAAAPVERCYSREIHVTWFGVDHVPKHHMIHLLAADVRLQAIL